MVQISSGNGMGGRGGGGIENQRGEEKTDMRLQQAPNLLTMVNRLEQNAGELVIS